jgi:hypothetical protein
MAENCALLGVLANERPLRRSDVKLRTETLVLRRTKTDQSGRFSMTVVVGLSFNAR